MRGAAVVAVACAVIVAGAASAEPHAARAPRLLGLRVTNGDTPFAGDGRLLTTVSPNGDGFRDSAIVSFKLDRAATIHLDVVRTDTIRIGRPAGETVWSTSKRFRRGRHRLVWRPSRSTDPRTYIMRLTVRDNRGHTRRYGFYGPTSRSRVNAPVVRVQGIDAVFLQRSYAPGEEAELSLATDAHALQLQIFYFRSQRAGKLDPNTSGVAMTAPLHLAWDHPNAPHMVRFARAGDWPSGLYFLRVASSDGRVSYAPLVVRPRRFGSQSRIAVVLSTNTWQAYNFRDENGDGWGDSWYVSGSIHSVDLRRPYIDFGVPFRFRDWDLAFVSWLNKTGRQVEYLSDDDLDRFRNGAELARAYDLVVFPGHAEYMTEHAYDIVERYRDLGGNLMFLAANNFFWKVERVGHRLVRVKQWRELGRPEASLVGVQYVGSNYGANQGPFVVTGAMAAPWAFAGTGLHDGDSFGRYGIEIDARTADSPPGATVLAEIPNILPRVGRSAEMTYYETPAGAKVFAAGALNFAASVDEPVVSRLLTNVWARLSRP